MGEHQGDQPPLALSRVEVTLVEAASSVRANAYAPYSDFFVGAAVLAPSGSIYTGCNVENASFGLTVCAERNALAAAIAAGEKKISAVAIASGIAPAAAPCGACRQVLAEFADELVVFLVDGDGLVQRTELSSLLPHRFRGQDLGGRH
jgi:cytidine deaminase